MGDTVVRFQGGAFEEESGWEEAQNSYVYKLAPIFFFVGLYPLRINVDSV